MTQKPIFVEGIFTLRNLRSMGAAAVVEVLIALGIAAALIWHQLQPVEQPLPPIGAVIPESPPVTPPLQHTDTTLQAPQAQPFTEVPSVPTDIPGPTTQPLQPLQPPVLSGGRTQPSGSVMSEFAARMLRAIEQQKVYPKVEMLKGETGEAVVSFDYVGGVVSDVHVDKSSGFHALDQAAIDAVEKATLPQKPAELAGIDHYVFTLAFDIGG